MFFVECFRGIDVGLDRVLTIEERGMADEKEIEDDIHDHPRVVNLGNQPAKKKSAVSQRAGPEVVSDVTQHHLVEIEKMNGMKKQKIVDEKKIKVVADLKSPHENRKEFPKKNRMLATMMLKNGLAQRIHQRENLPMTHQKKTWI